MKTDIQPDIQAALQQKLALAPADPGVYLMKDPAGAVIYVGKARNLKKRLAAYFNRGAQPDPKTGVLVSRIASFDTIVTRTEKEALILESNLIKRHRPRYNVVLKDDKRYPALRLNIAHPYPSLSIVRKIRKDGALYFGPFASAGAVRQTLKIVNKTFKLRKCSDREFKTRTRPCLNCQMQGCLAPCCRDVDRAAYDEMVHEVILFLKGRAPDLVRKVREAMMAAAAAEQFERAAQLRDKMFALEKTIERQIAVTTDLKDRDVIVAARGAELSLVTLLTVRGGFLQGSRYFVFTDTLATEVELIRGFIGQYYADGPHVPGELLVPELPEDSDLLADWLQTRRGRRVKILCPRRGEKARLIALARQNADKELQERLAASASGRALLEGLQRRLRLRRLPLRIECFDNSNIGGSAAVAGMVVFEDAKAAREAYRKFRIRAAGRPDDYAHMAEVLTRRLREEGRAEPLPDLLMVDGGKGQLNIALEVIRGLGLENAFDVIGIAKKDEARGETADKIFQPGRANPVNWGREGRLLLFLQSIRDEAHRFAITYHRRERSRHALESALDAVPGIGRQRKAMLLKHFGGIHKIRAASLEELASLPGMTIKTAGALQQALGEADG
jgi:excinuclease ABC subunit C